MKSLPSREINVATSSRAGASLPAIRDASGLQGQEAPNLLGIMWRYRWAVILPSMLGCVIGFLVYLQLPDVYRSTTRLLVESDRPAVLDTAGEAVGGVPPIGILQSHLYSDQVIEMAYNDARLAPFRDRFPNKGAFISLVQKSLVLEPEVTDERSAQSLVMLLHFDDTDKELCEESVKAFSDALQRFFNERQKSSREEFMQRTLTAIEQLVPNLESKEDDYRDFRRDAPLAWDAEGQAINPHRERQLFLIERRSELTEQLREKSIELASVESIVKNSKDPHLSLNVIGQLLNIPISLPEQKSIAQNLRESDEQLQQLALDEQLVPLMIKKANFVREYGENHPTVKQLDSELEVMKSELRRIVQEQAKRLVEIMEESQQNLIDPKSQAIEAVKTVVYAIRAEINLLKGQIVELSDQIATEKEEAIQLANIEAENTSKLRQIDRERKLLEQLQEQLAKINLTEESGSTSVIELSAPSKGYPVGPYLIACLGIGWFLGLTLGSSLAFMLEKNANTFREPDEIADFLGTPVLTHLPFFKGRVRKSKKGEINPFADLDPHLAVVHTPASVAAEAIRSCRTTLFFEMAGIAGGKVIQVTSPLPGDGKSTIAGNLACSIAQSGKKVLAIDCDLRRPQLTDSFVLADNLGLTNVLNGECDPNDACHQTPLPSLQVMPCGPIPSNPAEALTLAEMGELLDLLRERYEYIIIDTPPLLVVTDPSITASMVDGVLLALRIRRKSKPNSKESMNILRAVGARVLGVVINNSDEASASDGYRGYGYYRYGRYTSRYARGSSNASHGQQNGSTGGPMVVSGRGSTPMRSPAIQATITTDQPSSVIRQREDAPD